MIFKFSWRITAGLLLHATELENFWCSTMRSYQKLVRLQKPCLLQRSLQQRFCANLNFPLFQFEKEVSKPFETFQQFARGCE